MNERKTHWDKIYTSKKPNEVSWTQVIPKTSLEFVQSANLDKLASIIDIGGGDSLLVDFLLDEGYVNISVLDISEQALNKAKLRLGERAAKVNWIVSDVTEFQPTTAYDFWHDRAVFHFLTTEEQIAKCILDRKQARLDKQFSKADEIRMYLKEQGIELEDTQVGTSWRRIV